MTSWAKEVKAAGAQPTGAEVRNAATVALLRDGDSGLEVLMGKRATKMDFHGGAWVFPGGRLDDADWELADTNILTAAKYAAARESMEEASVTVQPLELVHVSNWLTPAISPKRFATWFFAGRAGSDHHLAAADGVESDAVRWFRPEDALVARADGEIELAPPQFVTLLLLAQFTDVDGAIASLSTTDPIDFQPACHFFEGGGAAAIYAEDIAYNDVALIDAHGPRHRLTMTKESWDYTRD